MFIAVAAVKDHQCFTSPLLTHRERKRRDDRIAACRSAPEHEFAVVARRREHVGLGRVPRRRVGHRPSREALYGRNNGSETEQPLHRKSSRLTHFQLRLTGARQRGALVTTGVTTHVEELSGPRLGGGRPRQRVQSHLPQAPGVGGDEERCAAAEDVHRRQLRQRRLRRGRSRAAVIPRGFRAQGVGFAGCVRGACGNPAAAVQWARTPATVGRRSAPMSLVIPGPSRSSSHTRTAPSPPPVTSARPRAATPMQRTLRRVSAGGKPPSSLAQGR